MNQGFGKIIRLYLPAGHEKGVMTAELSNWTGKVYRISREKLKVFTPAEMSSPGVYILLGKVDGLAALYIGEGEKIIQRLSQQVSKTFWQEVVLMVSKDPYLNKASVKYLEHRLYQIFQKSNVYTIVNLNIPIKPAISEAEREELEESLNNFLIILSKMGIYTNE
jgi:hypothetical protein